VTERGQENNPVPPEAPALFERVPVDLFSPLGATYARVYWSILASFFSFKFEANPIELARDEAVEIADSILESSSEWRERRDDLLSSLEDFADPEGDRTLVSEFALRRGTARRLVARLQRAGWFYFEFYRDTGEVLNFYPYAARLLGQMMSVARDEQPVLRGYAHAVGALLRADDFARSPGLAIGTVREQTLDFARELRILHGNIRESINRLFEEEITAAEVLDEALNRYRDRVRRNYNLLKTRDNISGWRIEILRRLDEIERQVTHIDEAARWYAENRGVSQQGARGLVHEHLETIRGHIEAMPRVINEIDERNQRFSGVAARRIAYLMRHDARMEGMLQALVDGLGAQRIPSLEMNVFRAEFLGPGFLYSPRRHRAKVENRKLRPRPKLDESAADAAFVARVLAPYRPEAVGKFVREIMAGRPRISISQIPLGSDEDYTRAVYIVMHGAKTPGRSGYRFRPVHCGPKECSDPVCTICRHVVGSYSIPNGHLERTRGGAGD
jgi:hypothetical protein